MNNKTNNNCVDNGLKIFLFQAPLLIMVSVLISLVAIIKLSPDEHSTLAQQDVVEKPQPEEVIATIISTSHDRGGMTSVGTTLIGYSNKGNSYGGSTVYKPEKWYTELYYDGETYTVDGNSAYDLCVMNNGSEVICNKSKVKTVFSGYVTVLEPISIKQGESNE